MGSTDKYYFRGDSIVGDKIYKKIYECRADEFCLNPIFNGLIREEEKKVYYISPYSTLNTEYLIYDFSLEEG
jgi:hypothetical protein